MSNSSSRLKLKLLSLIPILVLVSGIVAFSILLSNYTPEAVVTYIGIQNGYALMFSLALFSGVSLFTGVPYVLTMITLVAGGLNPLLIAFLATVGDACGSTLAYSLGRMSGTLAVGGFVRTIQNFLMSMAENHPWLLPLAIFAYGCAAPLSNDVVTIPMGIARYPYIKTMIPLQLGTFVYNSAVAFAGLYVYTYFFG